MKEITREQLIEMGNDWLKMQFVINGGGMETFLDEIASSYPKLRLIDSSEGITHLKNNSNHSTHSNEENTSP